MRTSLSLFLRRYRQGSSTNSLTDRVTHCSALRASLKRMEMLNIRRGFSDTIGVHDGPPDEARLWLATVYGYWYCMLPSGLTSYLGPRLQVLAIGLKLY
jgi:hypothetical protein